MARRPIPSDCLTVLIKEENVDYDEVVCRICNKGYASAVALRNHAFMEHIEAYSSGDPLVWTKDLENKPNLKQNTRVQMRKSRDTEEQRTKDIIAAMEPTSITSLASNNVSYIIVKSDELFIDKEKKKKKDAKVIKRSKSPQPISGPFECLEPSPMGADGTCHQIFFLCCEYSAHARAEHSRRRRAARCQVCERTLATGPAEAPYVCETCGEGFQTADKLQEHVSKVHIKLKPYKCSVCNKRFTQQGGVIQHMRMHTGQRPFPCTFCTKAFTQKSGLEQHLRTHTKAKPYRCVVCAKCFAQSVHLRQHMRTHTQLAPFHCPFCDKRFKQSSHLNYHLRNHDLATMTATQREIYKRLVRETQAGRNDDETSDTPDMEVVETEEEVESQELEDAGQVITEQAESEGDTYIIGGTYDEIYN